MLGKVLAATAIVLLLTRRGIAECYSEVDCGGVEILSSGSEILNQRDCCVNQNGLSYNDGGTCRPCIVHGFRQFSFDVAEDARLDTVFALNVTGTTQLPAGFVISGTITAEAAGTASNSDFERLQQLNVIINSDNPSTDVRLFTVNDEITLEFEDRVLLRFTPAMASLIPNVESNFEFIRDTAIVNIIDNDPLQINFGESDYSIEEGSTMLSSAITLQFRNNQNPFTVRLSPVTVGTAESKDLGFFINSGTITADSRATLDPPDPDFSADTIDVTIPADSTAFAVSTFFTIYDDNIDEDEQSFAIVAEILDVPDNTSCFQTAPGTIPCFGTRGATEIRITDNDPMVIGFRERFTNASEDDVPEGEDLLDINIGVATLRTAEREHPMVFRLQSGGTAIVEPVDDIQNLLFDALFGIRLEPDAPIQEAFDLDRLVADIPSLLSQIRDDLIPEEEECFTIRIFPVDVPGRRELFICNDTDSEDGDFFCETTICIRDNDDPFRVAFVEKTYTVDESVGAVNVCVNLTHPTRDILDETVNVFVIDDPSSIYIPDGAPLATPDGPDFLSQYPMVEGTDFAQQTRAVNVIDGIIINEERRIICYNQPIYDDPCLETDEYAGLTLGVIDVDDFDRTTVNTKVEPLCDHAAILILDNDRARVGLEQTFFRENEDVGVIELCAVVFEPDIECPIKFPFDVQLFTVDGSAFETMDYGALDVILMFDECERRRCVNVTITQDLVDEPDEFFTFHLDRTPDLSPRIELDPVNGTIEIVDDDVPITVGYNPVLYTTTEEQGFVVLNITIFDPPAGGTPRPFTLVVNTQDGTARAGPPDNDYVAVSGEIVQFNDGDTFQTHRIIINNDMECENMPNEEFFSNITFNSGAQPITVINPQALVTIDDSGEAECIEPSDLVNDTVTGDPLMTVPIYTTPENTLCYEVHGETDQTFNLISDNCVAVNAHYTRAVANNPNITLNVIDTIGVRAVATDDNCVNISVNLENCVAMVNDQPGTVPYQRNGISVRKYNNRVRIVVPNCGETDLVMWVFCTSGSTADPKTNIYYNFNFLQFVVRRGLNLNERSHGLIGQFWNIRIDVQEHLGPFNGIIRSDDYNITVRYPGSSPRSFVAIQSSVTWEFEKKPCLYVGNSQAGPLGEDVDPNDSVIEGAYKDYMVESIYSPNFKFAHIDENNCMTK